MQKVYTINQCLFYALYALCLHSSSNILLARQNNSPQPEPETITASLASQVKQKTTQKTHKISIDFDKTELVDIVNFLASEKGVNVILPKTPLTQTITFAVDHKITLTEAWTLLYTILELAGYAMMQIDEETYVIRPQAQNIAGEPTQLFVDTDPNQLPGNDERIRYIYYLKNIQIDPENPNASEISQLLKALLGGDKAGSVTNFRVDAATNAIIMTGKSNDIRASMGIVSALDHSDFTESIDIIRLSFISADLATGILEEILKPQDQRNRYRLDARKSNAATYFPPHLKVIKEPRTNSIIILGQKQALDRVRDFVTDHLDVPLDSGQSILHVYPLQYLDANTFKETLEHVVTTNINSTTGQSTGTAVDTGVERYFEGVIIRSDSATSVNDESTEYGSYNYPGGNKLIIAATQSDWLRIRALIAKLDVPQPQVIVEALIAELNIEDARRLGAMLRNPCDLTPPGLNFQSAQLAPAIVDNIGVTANTADPTTVATDLLRLDPYGIDTCRPSLAQLLTTGCTGIINALPGSTELSISERASGKTWLLTQLRKFLSNQKLISNPHFIATNNRESMISVGESRLVPDQASGTEGGTSQLSKRWANADLTIRLIPRINNNNSVTLAIDIEINRFTNETALFNQNLNFGIDSGQGENNRQERRIQTVATIADEDVLALGGLNRIDTVNTMNRTPLFGRIPVIGYFFKARNDDVLNTSIVIFFYVKIVMPREIGGIGAYTREKVANAKEVIASGNLFDSLRDPITRIFFDTQPTDEPQRVVDRFTELGNDHRVTESMAIRRLEREQLIAAKRPRICCDSLCDDSYHERGTVIHNPTVCDRAYARQQDIIKTTEVIHDPTVCDSYCQRDFCLYDEHLDPCYICDADTRAEKEQELQQLLKNTRLEPAEDRSYRSLGQESLDTPLTTQELVEVSENPDILYR